MISNYTGSNDLDGLQAVIYPVQTAQKIKPSLFFANHHLFYALHENLISLAC
jgi:hypothetical protein